MSNKPDDLISLATILEDGKKWQHELSVVLIEICKRLEKLENKDD